MLADFEALNSWLTIRCGKPIQLPDGFTPRGGLADPSIMLVREGVPKTAINLEGLRVALSYLDAHGESSTRVVRIRRAWRTATEGYVTAYCELREAPRCFAFSGMHEFVDLGTGEVVRDPLAFFEDLGVHALARDPNELAMWESIRDGVRVLAALAITDEVLFDDEVEHILVYADQRALDLGFRLELSDLERVRSVARRLRPDMDVARAAIARVLTDQTHGSQIIRAMRSLSASDDMVSATEMAFMQALSG